MSFDDDAVGEGAGFRPPPHPDDRLWRHPSEMAGARHTGFVATSRPRPQPRWPWGVVVAVGTVGVVVVTLGGALVLGLRGQVGGGGTDPEMAAPTTTAPALAAAPPAWLGIEGADQLMSAGGETSPSSTDEELIEPTPTEAGAIGDPGGQPLDPDPSEDDDRAPLDSSTTTDPGAPTGVVITSVDPHGPSANALQPGDVVLEVDGEPVSDMATLLATLGAYQPGDQVEITYMAGDTGEVETTAVVTLGARPEGLSVEASDVP